MSAFDYEVGPLDIVLEWDMLRRLNGFEAAQAAGTMMKDLRESLKPGTGIKRLVVRVIVEIIPAETAEEASHAEQP